MVRTFFLVAVVWVSRPDVRAQAQTPAPTREFGASPIQAEPSPEPQQAPEQPPSAISPDPFPPSSLAPVLLITEGLERELSVTDLRRRLGEALGREVVSLTEPSARRAQATIWIGVNADKFVIRVSPPQRAEAWRQIPREGLGADGIGTLVKAVLEMLWADAFARLDAGEIQDPFCPPGVICLDARRTPWPASPEVEVLDPWDNSYRRFYGWDPYWYGGRYGVSPWSAAGAARQRRRPAPYGEQWSEDAAAPGPRAPANERFAINLLAGGGVHKGGAFLRYEVDGLRRFPRFDFGLAYIGARGQPEPFQKVRRSVNAMLQRRFVSQDFELDLGSSFGIFFATLEGRSMEVRPYLRGLLTFALPLSRRFDLLVQSDLATTFASVPDTGAVEYALSMGLRQRL